MTSTTNGTNNRIAGSSHKLIIHYAFSVLLALVAFLIRYALSQWVGDTKTPFLTFYPAILLATLYGGFGPGLLCLALATFGSLYFLEPVEQFTLHTGIDQISLFTFVCVSAIILFVVDGQQKAKARADAHATEALRRQQRIEALQAQLQLRLKEAEHQAQLMETLLKQVPTGISIAEPPDVRIIKESRYGERISGMSAEELEGKPQAEVRGVIYHADGITPARDEELPLTRATLYGELIQDEEWVLIHEQTGQKVVLLCNPTPVYDEQGKIILGILAWRDITSLKAAQAEIVLLNERLHRAIYEASHRIKNQLQVLAATADIVLMENENSTTVPADSVRRLRTQITALAVTHDILTHETRIEGTANHLSIRALLQQILNLLQQTTDRHTIRYRLDDASVTVKAATSLALIVNEAVSNAIKHGSEWVGVTLDITDSQLCLEICDDGPGFPINFDPRRDSNTGIELLLALTQTDLQGTAEFTNRPEGGARLTICASLASIL